MIEHRPERVIGVGTGRGFLDGFRNRQPKRAHIAGITAQRIAPGLRHRRRTGEHLRSPGLHHRPPVRLLLVADLDHEHPHVDTKHLPCQRHRATPLPGAGLGRDALDAGLLVVVRLRHRGIRFMRSSRRNAFVLVVDFRRRSQHLFQSCCAHQRRRAPQPVNLANFLRNRNPALGRHFLLQDRHRKNRAHLFRRGRLSVRSKRRRRRIGHIRHHVVPMGRNFRLGKNKTQRFHRDS